MNISFNAYNNGSGINKTKLHSGVNGAGRFDSPVNSSDGMKKDVITISSGGAEYSHISKVSRTISNNVNECGSAEKIAAIKSQIADGRYNVSPEAVAGRILDRLV